MIDLIVDQSQSIHFPRGHVIFQAGDANCFSYVLLKGLVGLECTDHRRKPRLIQLARPGKLIGVEWLPASRRREIGAVAVTNVEAALITQEAIASVFARLSLDHRLGVMSYAWRSLSALVAEKAELRDLGEDERLHRHLLALGDPRASSANVVRVEISLVAEPLAELLGMSPERLDAGLAALMKTGDVKLRGRFLEVRPPGMRQFEPSIVKPYRGVPAPSARAKLDRLLEGCDHLGLNHRAVHVISRRASLFAVPAGEVLLPPRSEESVAFIVEGSAWLEGVGSSGRPFTIRLLPPGRFIRLPTRHSPHSTRFWGRARENTIVALLGLDAMREVVAALTAEGTRKLLDVTCRDLSRHLCDCTTAPTRPTACRLVQAFAFLGRDFPRGIEVRLDELARLVDVGRSEIELALNDLCARGWTESTAGKRFRLKELPTREREGSKRCAICSPETSLTTPASPTPPSPRRSRTTPRPGATRSRPPARPAIARAKRLPRHREASRRDDRDRFVFVSHAAQDASKARRVVEYLEGRGIRCWLAMRDSRPSREYADEIMRTITGAGAVVLVLSRHANGSKYVRREIERAVDRRKPVFPLRIQKILPSGPLEFLVSSVQAIDAWENPFEQHLDRLVNSILASWTPPARTRRDARRFAAKPSSCHGKSRAKRSRQRRRKPPVKPDRRR